MAASNPRDRAKARSTVVYEAITWKPLADVSPRPDELVMVMMKDGSIETARWDGKQNDWSRPPFSRWGDPVSWSSLPKPIQAE